MSSIHYFKLCKILADHDQCIQWCKENNLLASSIKCPRENYSNILTWTWRTSSRDWYEWRCSRRKWHRCAHTAHWKYMVGSQTKYASYRNIQRALRKLPTGMDLASALWRRSFWKHNQAYRRPIWSTQRCVNWSVSRNTVCTVRDLIVASWKEETKYTASTHGNELEEGNQEGKNHQRHDEGKHCFYFSSFSF